MSAAPSIAAVRARISQHYGLSAGALRSADRSQEISWPRHLAMYVALRLTGHTDAVIGRAFGGRSHTTVGAAHRKVAECMEADSAFRDFVEALCADCDAHAGAVEAGAEGGR